jgi:PAS domain S-box-containing protein
MLRKLFNRKSDSLAQRLTRALAVMVAVVTLIAVGGIYAYSMSRAQAEMEARAAAAAKYLESVLALPLWNYDDDVIITIGRTMMQDPGYTSIAIGDNAGRTIYTGTGAASRRPVSAATAIKYRDVVVGEVRLALASESFESQAREVLVANLLILLFILMTITAGAAFLIRRFLNRPLKQLQAFAEAYGAGNYAVALEKSDFSEFQPFVDVLDKMGKQIQGQVSELRDREEWFRLLFDQAADAVYLYDEAGTLMDVNRQGCRDAGYARDELIGMNIVDILEDTTGFAGVLVCREVRLFPLTLEGRARRKNGDSFPVEIRLGGLRLREQDAFLALVRDITERKRSQDALRRSEKEFRELVESANSIILRWNPEGEILFINPYGLQFFGFAEDELIGRKIAGTIVPERESVSHRDLWEMLEDIRRHPENYQYNENENIKKNGERVWISWSNRLVTDEDRHFVEILSIGNDMTEKKKLESQLAQAQKMEAIGTLAGGIAHDFNNLLMGILGNASLAMMDLARHDRNYERLQRIETQVLSGANLTKQLLGFARGGRYEVKPADINRVIAHSVEMFGRTRKDISIVMKFGEPVRAVDLDHGQMEQVFINLLLNAAHAMPAGGELRLETENVTLDRGDAGGETAGPGRYVRITVTDTGVGMDEKTLSRIFDPFFTTREMGRGTGLGLAMVYGIVRGHGGVISAESEPGRGTRFTIHLPVSDRRVAGDMPVPTEVRRGTETILLVEDEETVMNVGAELLESLGHRVFRARSGSEALTLYREKGAEIDLIILDMVMPEMSGSRTFDGLKEMNPDIRVILASGYSINGQAQEITDRGCRGFLQKPFTMAQLSRAIREAMDA